MISITRAWTVQVRDPARGRRRKNISESRARHRAPIKRPSCRRPGFATVNLRIKILDFRRLDSSRILRGGIIMSIGSLPEVSSQRIVVGIILVGRLGVHPGLRTAGRTSMPSLWGELRGSQGRGLEHRSTWGFEPVKSWEQNTIKPALTYDPHSLGPPELPLDSHRAPPRELHPVSITRFPLRRFSPGAGLLRNPFVHR